MEENFVFSQVYAFAVSCVVGVIWLSIYDVMKIVRHTMGCNRIITAVCDVLFWLIGVALVILTALFFNGGFLRSYLFVGVLVGAVFYMLTIGSIVKKIWRIVAGLMSKFTIKKKTTDNL